MRRLQRLIAWMTTLCVSLLVSGCVVLKDSDYCSRALHPFEWRTDSEIDQTPPRVIRYVEAQARIWEKACASGRGGL